MTPMLQQLIEGRRLSAEQAQEAFETIMSGKGDPAQVAALLALIQARGLDADLLVAAARAMRQRAVPVSAPEGCRVLDTCGTGGAGARTFNISTTAALVAAAALRGRKIVVAKHGNRSVTSVSGSSQVLESLGVSLGAQPAVQARCLEEAGMCFCFAANHHPAMKHVVPIRAALGVKTVFNVLGPLTNPAKATLQVLGVYHPSLLPIVTEALASLGATDALVLHTPLEQETGAKGPSGLGELVPGRPALAMRIRRGKITSEQIPPDAAELAPIELSAIEVDGPEASAAMVQSVLSDEPGPARDTTCLNAAAALEVAGVVETLTEGVELARRALAEREAQRVLDQLTQLTHAEG